MSWDLINEPETLRYWLGSILGFLGLSGLWFRENLVAFIKALWSRLVDRQEHKQELEKADHASEYELAVKALELEAGERGYRNDVFVDLLGAVLDTNISLVDEVIASNKAFRRLVERDLVLVNGKLDHLETSLSNEAINTKRDSEDQGDFTADRDQPGVRPGESSVSQ